MNLGHDWDQFEAMPRVLNNRPAIRRLILAAAIGAGTLGMPVMVAAQALLPDLAQTEAAMKTYEALSNTDGWPKLRNGPSLKLGAIDSRLTVLRERLRVTGDYRLEPKATEGPYDPPLDYAVRRFQARHGLVVDGVVGPRTRAALNVPAAERAAMLRRNLLRIRNLPHWPDRFVLVQVPAFETAAIDHGATALRSRAIVGRQTRQTPELRSAIREVVFNPYWTVPIKIARRDIAPKMLENPNYLADRGIRAFASWAVGAPEIDPAAINWADLPTTIKLRQEPGPKNALGTVKFLFPNPYDVYLHDTPNRTLFERLPRAFSSGCVRLDRAVDLAVWLLSDEPQWPDGRIRATAASGIRTPVRLPTPVPVIFIYLTAWAGRDGVVQFRNDLYAHDRLDEVDDSATEPYACHVDDPAVQP